MADPMKEILLYFPLTKDLYEIKFVEREQPFYQFGKIQYYTMTAEIYEYGSDDISTGVEEIDEIETTFSSAIKLVMDPGGSGDFIVGEEVVGDEFLAKATATTDGDAVDGITITDSGLHYNSALPPQLQFLEEEEMEQQPLQRLVRLVLLLVSSSLMGVVVIQLILMSLLITHLKTIEQKSSPGILQPETSKSSIELEHLQQQRL